MRNALNRKPGAGDGLLIAIDPSTKATGVAVFDGADLIDAWLEENPFYRNFGCNIPMSSPAGVEVVIEVPRSYGRGSEVDPNDLVKVAFVAGWMARTVEPTQVWTVFPQDWKGQTNKRIDNARTTAKLNDTERQTVLKSTTKGKLHNVLDAVGIGLWALGRRE